jgi:hypothetical protein
MYFETSTKILTKILTFTKKTKYRIKCKDVPVLNKAQDHEDMGEQGYSSTRS